MTSIPSPSNEARGALDELDRGTAAVHDRVVALPRFFWQVAALVGPALLWARTDDLRVPGVAVVALLLAVGTVFQLTSARSRGVRSTLWSRPGALWLLATSFAVAIGYGAALNIDSGRSILVASLVLFAWLATVPAMLWARFEGAAR